MKNIFSIVVLLFLISCKKESEKSTKMKLGELALYEVCTYEMTFYHGNYGENDEIRDTISSNNKVILKNFLAQPYFKNDTFKIEYFKNNSVKNEVYFLDNSKLIKFKYNYNYNYINFLLQKEKENFYKGEQLRSKFKGLILKDLDSDGVKEVIVLSHYESNYSINIAINIFSVFR